MTKLRRLMQLSALTVFCFVLTLSQSCVRSEPMQPADAVASGNSKQELPFHPDTEQATTDDGGPSAPASEPKTASGLPFRKASHARIVPSGTLLTVDLLGSLSTVKVHAGDRFTATVAAPLTIDGETLIPRGTPVSGRVESSRSQPGPPGSLRGSGYFRLTLTEMAIDGRPISLQTSSLFARGTSTHQSVARTNAIGMQNGRSLTFWLTAPVTVADSSSIANSAPTASPNNNAGTH